MATALGMVAALLIGVLVWSGVLTLPSNLIGADATSGRSPMSTTRSDAQTSTDAEGLQRSIDDLAERVRSIEEHLSSLEQEIRSIDRRVSTVENQGVPLFLFALIIVFLILLIATAGLAYKANENRKREISQSKHSSNMQPSAESIKSLADEVDKLEAAMHAQLKSLKKKVERLESSGRQTAPTREQRGSESIREYGTSPNAGDQAAQDQTQEAGDGYADGSGEEDEPDEEQTSGKETTGDRYSESQKPQDSPAEAENEVGERTREAREERLLKEANMLLADHFDEGEFEDHYSPQTLTIANEQERMEDSDDATVCLKKDSRGQYWAVEMDGMHMVLPNPDITIRDSLRRQGGFDKTFQCDEQPSNEIYKVDSVESLARFRRRSDGVYELDQPGEVRLRRR